VPFIDVHFQYPIDSTAQQQQQQQQQQSQQMGYMRNGQGGGNSNNIYQHSSMQGYGDLNLNDLQQQQPPYEYDKQVRFVQMLMTERSNQLTRDYVILAMASKVDALRTFSLLLFLTNQPASQQASSGRKRNLLN